MYDPNNPFAYNADPLAFGPGAAYGMPSTPDPQKKRDLYARLFERFAGKTEPNAPYQMDDADKHHDFQRGLLQFAAAVSKPNGGNFANSLASGLLSGSNSMNDAQDQYANDAYRNDIMKRTADEAAANTQLDQLKQQVVGPDGKIDEAKFAQYAASDPTGAKALREAIQPQQKWTPVTATINGAQGTLLSDGQGNLRQLNGQPFTGAQDAPQGAPAPTTGGAPQIMGDALTSAVQSVESGGNPNAVSPKGAVGLMQTMPNTLRDPGFGVTPARDNSPQEQARVGRDYLAAMTKQYGLQGGLAAYNMGPGAWQASIAKYGSPDAALAHAPAETQAYVPKVLARVGGAPTQPQGAALPFGFSPKKGDTSVVDKRKQELADLEASGVPVSKDMRNTYLMSGKMPDAQSVTVPGDPTKTGAAYLATLPPEMRNVVKAIASGQQDPPSASSKGTQAQALLQAVYAYDPTADASNLPVRRKTRLDYTSGTSFKNMRALNQVAAHLDQLNSQIGEVAGHDFTPLNALQNATDKMRGKTGIIDWNSTADAVAHETRALFAGSGGGTLDELHGYLDTLSANNSTDQKRAALRNIARLVKSRTQILADGYKQGMGTATDPFRVTFPHAASALDKLIGGEESTAKRVRYDAQGNRIP